MIKHQAIQLGIAKLGCVRNSWRHYSFLASAQSWSKDGPQFDKQWHMTKDKEPELGVNKVCCRRQVSVLCSKEWHQSDAGRGPLTFTSHC